MPSLKVFLAHPKDLSDEEIVGLVQLVGKLVPGDISVTVARDSFLAWEKRYGKPTNWNAWMDFVTGTDSAFGNKPRFDRFIVAPKSSVGKGTAKLIEMALQRRREVYRLTPEGSLERCSKVVVLDSEDWKHGFCIA